jgi:hypothetical protein
LAITAGREPALRAITRPSAPALARVPRTEPSPRTPAEEADTVVHVTIGRIDVRAIMTAPANPAPRPQRARRSLDDYLAGRRR